MSALAVVGTDTGVGKTVVSAIVSLAWSAREPATLRLAIRDSRSPRLLASARTTSGELGATYTARASWRSCSRSESIRSASTASCCWSNVISTSSRAIFCFSSAIFAWTAVCWAALS